MVKTILFDLDGTLLPIDTDELVQGYFGLLARHMAHLIPPEVLPKAIWASTHAMLRDTDPQLTNAEAFWADFEPRVGHFRVELEPAFTQFYREVFPRLGPEMLKGRPLFGPRAVQAALDLGYEVAVATNPLFPREAILARLKWAGVADLPWQHVTTLEEYHACKPHTQYYEELLARLGRRPEECLMVGNDIQEDGVVTSLGMPFYAVTDYLIHRGPEPLPDPHGSLADFAGWLQQNRP